MELAWSQQDDLEHTDGHEHEEDFADAFLLDFFFALELLVVDEPPEEDEDSFLAGSGSAAALVFFNLPKRSNNACCFRAMSWGLNGRGHGLRVNIFPLVVHFN